MIPSIEQICNDLKAGKITLPDAIMLLQEHEKLQGKDDN